MNRVLIVDDHAENRYLLRALLAGSGHVIDEARDGSEALAMAHRDPPDMVISDLLMPVMDGYTLLRHWKADERLRSVPFIIYTATYIEPSDERLALDLGADAFIIKPVETETFLRRISEVSQRAARGELAPTRLPAAVGGEVVKGYNQALVRKLEKVNRRLRESTERYRQLFEANPHPMWVYDTATLRFLAVNDAAVHFYGWSREEFLAMTIADIRPPEDEPALREAIGQFGSAMGGHGDIWQHRKRDGTLIEVEITSHPLAFAGHDARVVLAHDISAHRRAEEIARESERFARSTLDSLSAHVAILDGDGTIIAVNRAWRQFARNNASAMQTLRVSVGANYLAACDRVTGPEAVTAHAFADGIRAVMGSMQMRFHLEYPCHSPTERRWFDGRVTRFVGAGPLRVVVAHEDITDKVQIRRELESHRHNLERLVEARTAELAEARREAEAASRAKSAFLANMSHEIRTPMNGVLGMIEVLARTRLSSHQRGLIETIRTSGMTLLGVIDDILDFSKIEAGGIEIAHAPLSVADMVERLCQSLVPVAETRGVDLTLHLAADIPVQVASDELRLRQILYNLIGNAIKFSGGCTDTRGLVEVRVTVDSHTPWRLRFTVTDNGIGMSEDTQARLFTPFDQAETSITRRFGGTGLGLTICKRLVELMGGTIGVESAPGHGATFSAVLPMEIIDATPAVVPPGGRCRLVLDDDDDDAGPAATTEVPASPDMPVLVAEDDEINRRVIREQLRLLGCRAVLTRNGREALERWRGGDFAVLITDLHMPDMDGYALTRSIRAEEATRTPGRRLPIVVLSANALRDEALQARAAGVDEYLTKPLQIDRLAGVLGRWLPAAHGGPLPATGGNAMATPDETGELLDPAALGALLGGDAQAVERLFKAFITMARPMVEALCDTATAGDLVRAGQYGHRLKASARAVGARTLGQLAGRLERRARAGSRDEVAALAGEIRTLLPRVEARIRELQPARGGTPTEGARP